MFLNRLIVFVICILISNILIAQVKDDYSKNWKIVADFEKKGLTQSALNEVIKIFNDAVKSGNDVQQVKSVMYQLKYRNMVEEDNSLKNYIYLDSLVGKTKVPVKNILQSIQAELLWSYLQYNRYRLYDRTNLAEENNNDIQTWSAGKLNETIATLYRNSLLNQNILQASLISKYDPILIKGTNTRHLRPTLFDFLAHRALTYFMNDEHSVIKPSYAFVINDQNVFAPAKTFINLKITTQDTSSLYYNALVIFKQLLQFHVNDKDPAAFIDADLIRLSFAHQHGVFTNKDQLYEEALKNIESTYPNETATAQAMYLRAALYSERGQQYNPDTKKQYQFELKKAIDLANLIIKKFPGTEGALNSKSLLTWLTRPERNMEVEKVNIPGTPFKALIRYKNIKNIHFRIIRTSRDQLKAMEKDDYQARWRQIVGLKSEKSWSISLPDPGDHQLHSTEIKIDGLPAGTYMILSSIDPQFSMSDNLLTRVVTHVSLISYIINNKKELYVLDRNDGKPLAGAEVQVWSHQYNYTSRNYEQVKKERYTSDANGYVKMTPAVVRNNENYNTFIQVKHNKQELFTDDSYYLYDYYNGYPKTPGNKKAFLFTDRSIYRPGQTVFFKGIVVQTDSATKKSSIINNQLTSLILFDANNQKIGKLALKTNEYGSYTGNFKLPEGILNGQFHITDSINNSTLYFNVEEYKRPKFLVEVEKPAGTYRINDNISVTGNALAYAGNPIDGAVVTYRVVRKVRYPIWRWSNYRIWPPYGRGEEMEITNGNTRTDTKGNFTFYFKAIPDGSIDKKDQPIFNYEISASVTDVNGETRSSNITISVAYQALQLEIIAPDKLIRDSIKNIKVISTNMNSLYEKATVNFTVHKLQEPGKIFRARYWQVPDQFVMTKQEFTSSFPHDAYMDEDQVSKWPVGEKVIDITDTTSSNGSFKINQQLPAGWYKILVLTKDKYGEPVKAEKFIQIIEDNRTTEPIQLIVRKKLAQPGEKVSYAISTGFDNIWLIQNIIKVENNIEKIYSTITLNTPFTNTLSIAEKDRGGINIGYAFVKNNRVYHAEETITIPWSNKELSIGYETFRDKIIPGSTETWKVNIKGNKGEKVAAEMLVNMYDASLDQFKKHDWIQLKSLWPLLAERISWTLNTFAPIASEVHMTIKEQHIAPYTKIYDHLLYIGGRGDRDGYRRMNRPPGAPVQHDMQMSEVVVTNAVSGKAAGIVRPEASIGEESAQARQADTAYKDKEVQAQEDNEVVQIRKNFNETAFFFPSLTTDKDGNVSFSFTIPEALTKWKLMTFAHTKDLQSGYLDQTVVTQKPLMVQPNAPRFLREADQIELSAKIVNMHDGEVTGTVQLELFDAVTNKPVDGWFNNVFPSQYFTVAAGESFPVRFPLNIPVSFNSALTYRIKAVTKPGKDNTTYSDGEEAILPVVTNRMLVTESFPIYLRNTSTKNFSFDKLLSANNSGTLTHHGITVEYSSNPSWYAVQALPFLTAPKNESADQNFNSFYANVLAGFIANSSPRIKQIFDKWRITDTAALISNLQKNEELKSVLIQETPWVMQAQNETQQKKNIALLFDIVRMSAEKEAAFQKLKQMQSTNGGFVWFKGGPDDRYITQYIVAGIGHLKKLKALSSDDQAKMKSILDKAVPYLDARLKQEYDQLVRNKVSLKENHLNSTIIHYLYMRSFFPEYRIGSTVSVAYDYYKTQAQKYWLSNGKYQQGMIALTLHRTGDSKTAKEIIASLKQNAIYKEELGMYWKDLAIAGYFWHQAPVESQALMIEVFNEIDRDPTVVDNLKTWLLRQKQVQNWRTPKATAEAIYALLLTGSDWLADDRNVSIKIGNTVINSDKDAQAGTGYIKQTIPADKVQQGMGNISVSITPSGTNNNTSSSWGAVYWQYFEELDKITSAETPLKLVKNVFVEKKSDRGPVLKSLKDGDELKIGDKVKIRIELRVDRDMEYIHMKDMRASSMEPVNVLSQYKYQGGLGYYETTKDVSTNFFFPWLRRGTYVFEYPMFVTHSGNFSNGITTIQSMYAPEFSSHSNGIRISVNQK